MTLVKLFVSAAVLLVSLQVLSTDVSARVPAEDVRIELTEPVEAYLPLTDTAPPLVGPEAGTPVIGVWANGYRYSFTDRLLRPPCRCVV